MKKKVVFIEVAGGNDKGPDGHRRDTMPMVEALRARGWEATVVYYDDLHRHELFRQVVEGADAFVSRVNPGHVPGGERTYLEMLRYIGAAGVQAFPPADDMISLGAKDALVKLAGSHLALPDTYAYHSVAGFEEQFPLSLAGGDRVLKQNRGSTGSGIWHVTVTDERDFPADQPLPADTLVKCVEAVDNHVEHHRLGDFMRFCERYIVGDDGMLVDMRYLARIKEGEIRVLMVGEKPMFVVHKKPAEGADAFSATLFSGATYTYDSPDHWPRLIAAFEADLPLIRERFGAEHLPLIWTADFILDTDEQGQDRYVLGEMNCSCVGFTSQLDLGIQDAVAEEIIATVMEHEEQHAR